MKCLDTYKEFVTFSDCDHCHLLEKCLRNESEEITGYDPRIMVIESREFNMLISEQIRNGTVGWMNDNFNGSISLITEIEL